VEHLISLRSASRGWLLRRLCEPVLCRSPGRPSATSSVRPPWWWKGAGDVLVGVFCNKRLCLLLWNCLVALLLLLSLTGRGGLVRDSTPASICSYGEGRGVHELNHDGGNIASTIYYRQGGGTSTSSEEAQIRSSSGCSRPSIRDVIRSPRIEGGPLLQIVAGKGLSSSRLRILGGIAWRTPARGDGDTRGLDCIPFLVPGCFV
jgi:hypothetical protein